MQLVGRDLQSVEISSGETKNALSTIVARQSDFRVNPAIVYIETLETPKSKQTMREALNRLVREYLQPEGDEIVFENLEDFP